MSILMQCSTFNMFQKSGYSILASKVIIKECEMCRLEKSCFHQNQYSYTLTLKNKRSEHLLHPKLIDSVRTYFWEVKSNAPTKGSVLITTAEGESFCEGFPRRYAEDQAKASSEVYKNHYNEMINGFKHVVSDLISLPMPTIAAVNGYAFEAGLMLGLSHDYLTLKDEVNPVLVLRAGFLARKMTLPGYFPALIRSKVGHSLALRDLVLMDLQIHAEEAAKIGLLDLKHEAGEDALEVAQGLAETLAKKEWDGEVYAEIRKSLYPELCKELELTCTTILPNLRS